MDLVRIELDGAALRSRRLFAELAPFGDLSLVSERARSGRPGTVRVRTLAIEAEARVVFAHEFARRHRRGYRPRATHVGAADGTAKPGRGR